MIPNPNQQGSLPIHVHLASEYQVFDRSGQLPFHVIFGLRRKSKTDTDSRALILDIKGSALDVPYALANGLLRLRAQSSDRKPDVDVDVSRLPKAEGETSYITLPSPSDRVRSNTSIFGSFTTYCYKIDSGHPLTSLLEPGKRYSIDLPSKDLWIRRYAYGNVEQLANSVGEPLQFQQQLRFISGKSASGKAVFKILPSLRWPPKVETHMCFNLDQYRSDTASRAAMLDFSFENTGIVPVSIQCRGCQHYLSRSDLFVPNDDNEARIINPLASGLSCLQINDARTGALVSKKPRRRICHLYDTKADRRIRLRDLVTLVPREPLIRRVDISDKLATLPNGEYSIRLITRGVWWSVGTTEQISDPGDDRVTHKVHRMVIPPLELHSSDKVVLRVVSGIVVGQSP